MSSLHDQQNPVKLNTLEEVPLSPVKDRNLVALFSLPQN